MKAAVIYEHGGPGSIQYKTDYPDPAPSAGEALVRVRRIGICGTDLHAYAGRQPFFSYPRVLGHELSVTVERVPAGDTRVRAD